MSTPAFSFSPACERNKGPILEVLERVLPHRGTVLEIGSGTGQHVIHFSTRLSSLRWQPSDRETNLPGLQMRIQQEGGANVLPPVVLDVMNGWPPEEYDAIYSANTAHIMSWTAVCAMFEGVADHLVRTGVFCLYGPFNEHGSFTAPSNATFHEQLKSENPEMGLRDIGDLENLAASQQLELVRRFPLPANNQILQFAFAPGSGTCAAEGEAPIET